MRVLVVEDDAFYSQHISELLPTMASTAFGPVAPRMPLLRIPALTT